MVSMIVASVYGVVFGLCLYSISKEFFQIKYFKTKPIVIIRISDKYTDHIVNSINKYKMLEQYNIFTFASEEKCGIGFTMIDYSGVKDFYSPTRESKKEK